MNDAELYELSDDELIAYIVKARAAGRSSAAELGVRILAFKQERQVTGFMFNQLGSKGPEVVEQVAARTIADAIAAAASFEGESIEEFRGFLFRIAHRRRVDYLRKNRVDEVPLVNEHDEDAREREFAGGGDPLEAVDRASVFNQAFEELGKDSHKLVVLLTVFHDLPAKETAEQVNRQFAADSDDPMTEQNVNKINSRFRKRLDELLDD
ncbi:MAG: sigma-70 family RNA polymerase sigma factor [Chloroflexi bacterium]|nr:sigma-70 family RNA polymerase sigma factor [Chloroflexota bacterium]